MRRAMGICAAVILFFSGLCLLLYPYAMGEKLDEQSDLAVESFIQTHAAEKAPEAEIPYPELYEAMESYNHTLYIEKQAGLNNVAAYTTPSFDLTAYGIEDGIIAVLSVPIMELEMPVYLGASTENMARGAVHLSQTSLPVGGDNTNCVIAGHRGYSGAPYFLHIDILQQGDSVILTTLWETLEYTVSEIAIIEPHDVDKVLIQEGRELLTLMSCHPLNSGGRYRYLVICERCI